MLHRKACPVGTCGAALLSAVSRKPRAPVDEARGSGRVAEARAFSLRRLPLTAMGDDAKAEACACAWPLGSAPARTGR